MTGPTQDCCNGLPWRNSVECAGIWKDPVNRSYHLSYSHSWSCFYLFNKHIASVYYVLLDLRLSVESISGLLEALVQALMIMTDPILKEQSEA
jgi:hypothetical protein